jgi:hypothetical protein
MAGVQGTLTTNIGIIQSGFRLQDFTLGPDEGAADEGAEEAAPVRGAEDPAMDTP